MAPPTHWKFREQLEVPSLDSPQTVRYQSSLQGAREKSTGVPCGKEDSMDVYFLLLDSKNTGRKLILAEIINNIGLQKYLLRFFHHILQKNPSELFG